MVKGKHKKRNRHKRQISQIYCSLHNRSVINSCGTGGDRNGNKKLFLFSSSSDHKGSGRSSLPPSQPHFNNEVQIYPKGETHGFFPWNHPRVGGWQKRAGQGLRGPLSSSWQGRAAMQPNSIHPRNG